MSFMDINKSVIDSIDKNLQTFDIIANALDSTKNKGVVSKKPKQIMHNSGCTNIVQGKPEKFKYKSTGTTVFILKTLVMAPGVSVSFQDAMMAIQKR
jgi:hypothetical protein